MNYNNIIKWFMSPDTSYFYIKTIIYNTIKIIFTLILMYAIVKIFSNIINKIVNKKKKFKFSLDEKRSKTLGEVLKSILRYMVYFFGIMTIIDVIFGKMVLTFAGIGGLAIGFGAQDVIKDIINGFFILFEDQYSVGDFIEIQEKSGIVESIELRVTKLRDFSGDLHIVPNGLITKVTNHSRGNMRIMLDIEVAYEEDSDLVMDIITNTCEKFKLSNINVIEGPSVMGISALKENSVTIKVMGKVKSMTQWKCEMDLRRDIKQALKDGNIKVPYQVRKVIKE